MTTGTVETRITELYRTESRRVLATLIRLLGDFDLAEEALHDAFTAAMVQWPRDGVPDNPRAWLISTGRFKAIDAVRRRARFVADPRSSNADPRSSSGDPRSSNGDLRSSNGDLRSPIGDLGADHPSAFTDPITDHPSPFTDDDDRLRLVFVCCHPALGADARVALTLREVCGLTTEEIASAFLTTAPVIAQRIVRAKAKIRDARIPYHIPERDELPARLDGVLSVIYLVFNEGYSPAAAGSVTRADLSTLAIDLARTLAELLPEPEAIGLLALLLLIDARRAARTGAGGEPVMLEDQDRSRWNRAEIDEGRALVRRALAARPIGPFALQAAIAAVHADAPTAGATDWPEIVSLYDLLRIADPSPVVELNRAAAIAMRDGPAAGLALIDALFARGALTRYRHAHLAHAELCRRAARFDAARASYARALELTGDGPERRWIERKAATLPAR